MRLDHTLVLIHSIDPLAAIHYSRMDQPRQHPEEAVQHTLHAPPIRERRYPIPNTGFLLLSSHLYRHMPRRYDYAVQLPARIAVSIFTAVEIITV